MNIQAQRLPYPGLDPYGFDQRELFFGRSAEGRVVSAMIATEPLSILTGASGTGKSSLIRAAVLPNLLNRGWCAVYAHPAQNSVEALKDEMLAQGVPDPELELAFTQRLIACSKGCSITWTSTLSEAQSLYLRLPVDDPWRLQVVGTAGDKIPRIPLTALALTGVVPVDRVGSSLAEMCGVDLQTTDVSDLSLQKVADLLGSAARGRQRLRRTLLVGSPTLGELAGRLWRDWLQPVGWCGLVVLLDQAEELYTAYERHGLTTQLDDLRRSKPAHPEREELFSSSELGAFVTEAAAQPLRLCFSLRPEWYTDLRVSLGEFAPDEQKAVHILTGMGREEARRAIEEPARLVGGSFDPRACSLALVALEQHSEHHGIDPFLLAVICQLAWNFAGADSIAGSADSRPVVQVTAEHLARISAGPDGKKTTVIDQLVSGALLWLVHIFLDGLEMWHKFDALEMLEGLFTPGGTRRIVLDSELVNRPLRRADVLRDLLDEMAKKRIVRIVQRGKLNFVEIRHDRLFSPLTLYKARIIEDENKQSHGSNQYRSLLGKAIEMLLNFDGKRLSQEMADLLKHDVLPGWVRQALRQHRSLLAWDRAAARVVLASILHNGPSDGSETGNIDPEAEIALDAYRAELRELIGNAVCSQGTVPEQMEVLELELLRGGQVPLAAIREMNSSDIRTLRAEARMLLLEGVLRYAPEILRRFTVLGEVDRWTHACLGQVTET